MRNKFLFCLKISLLVAAVVFFIYIIQKDFRRAQLRTLNYCMPSSYVDLLGSHQGAGKKTLQPYIRYYHLVTTITKGNEDAYAVLGVCYSRMGQQGKALEFFKRAVTPHSFWALYNMGVIYLKQGNYVAADKVFSQAGAIPPQEALKAMMQSKVYMDIAQASSLSIEGLSNQLQQGYGQAYQLLALSRQLKANTDASVEIEQLIRGIDVQVF